MLVNPIPARRCQRFPFGQIPARGDIYCWRNRNCSVLFAEQLLPGMQRSGRCWRGEELGGTGAMGTMYPMCFASSGTIRVCVEQIWGLSPLCLPRGHRFGTWDAPTRQSTSVENDFDFPFSFPVLFLMAAEPNLLLLCLVPWGTRSKACAQPSSGPK